MLATPKMPGYDRSTEGCPTVYSWQVVVYVYMYVCASVSAHVCVPQMRAYVCACKFTCARARRNSEDIDPSVDFRQFVRTLAVFLPIKRHYPPHRTPEQIADIERKGKENKLRCTALSHASR